MDWRTIAAVYGAGLSTALALVKLDSPIVTVAPARTPTQPPYILLQIINPSKRPLFITGSSQIRCSGPREKYRMVREGPNSLREDIARVYAESVGSAPDAPSPKAYVPAEETVTLRVTNIKDGSGRVIVIWWHRNWWPLSFIKLPAFARVTSDIAKQINPQ